MKKLLVLLAGLSVFLCASPVFATNLIINIPYAQHGDGWWSGLALSNSGPNEIVVTLNTTHHGSPAGVGGVKLPPYSQDVRLLPDFFSFPYPTENGGRISLRIVANGGSSVEDDFKCTIFVGNGDGGFGFESYGKSYRVD